MPQSLRKSLTACEAWPAPPPTPRMNSRPPRSRTRARLRANRSTASRSIACARAPTASKYSRECDRGISRQPNEEPLQTRAPYPHGQKRMRTRVAVLSEECRVASMSLSSVEDSAAWRQLCCWPATDALPYGARTATHDAASRAHSRGGDAPLGKHRRVRLERSARCACDRPIVPDVHGERRGMAHHYALVYWFSHHWLPPRITRRCSR